MKTVLNQNLHPGKFIKSIISYLLEHSTRNVEVFGAPYGLFVAFTVSNLCFVPFFFPSNLPLHWPEFLVYLRVLANFFCFLLIMRDSWPKKFIKYLPLYWHFTLFFCLPYFAMTTCLFTSCAFEWVICLVLTIFMLGILADWKTYLLSLIVGALSSVISFVAFGDVAKFNTNIGHFPVMAYAILSSLLVGAIFSRYKEHVLMQKLATFRALGGTIAHEMRTPLSSIGISANGLKGCLPQLVTGYEAAKEHGLPVPAISRLTLESIKNCPERLSYICASTINVIDMLLFQLKGGDWNTHFGECSIKNCINNALNEYCFREGERELIDTDGVIDFTFRGHESLVVHIVFNLLRNALAFIQSEKKGHIILWTSRLRDEKKLHFRDTAKGISPEYLPYIFEHGFSKRPGGSGVGLYYCKQMMALMGGTISVDSLEGEHCEFVLTF